MAKKSRYLQVDKTEKFYTTPRQEGTFLYFTGRGDDIATGATGAGQQFLLTNTSVDPVSYKEVIGQFNETVFLKDGYIFWQNAVPGDRVSLEIVLPAGVVHPCADQKGNAADVNGEIVNITASATPDETWVGTHFLFPIDMVLFRFVNELSLVGSNEHGLVLESPDAAEIPSYMQFRLSFKSDAPNPDIVVSVMMEMYRTNTI